MRAKEGRGEKIKELSDKVMQRKTGEKNMA